MGKLLDYLSKQSLLYGSFDGYKQAQLKLMSLLVFDEFTCLGTWPEVPTGREHMQKELLVNEVFRYNRDVTKELLGCRLGYSRDRDKEV